MKKLMIVFLVLMLVVNCFGVRRALSLPDVLTYTEIDNFDSTSGWTTSNCSIATVSGDGDVLTGTGSMKMTTAVSTNSNCKHTFSTKTLPATVALQFKIDNPSNVSSIQIYLHTVTGYYKFFMSGNGRANYGAVADKWTYAIVRADQMAPISGPPDWGTVADPTFPCDEIWLQIVTNSGGEANVTFGRFTSFIGPDPVAVIFFDDAYDSVYDNAFPILKAAGVKGVVGAISSLVGNAGFMTVAELLEVQAAGWDVVNHTWANTDFNDTGTPSYPSLITDENLTYYNLQQSKQWMLDNGLISGIDFMVWPHNAGDTSARSAGDISEQFCVAARGTTSRLSIGDTWHNDQTLNTQSSWIPNDWQGVAHKNLGVTNDEDWDLDTDVNDFVDITEALNMVACLYTHRVQAVPTSIDVTPEYLTGLIEHLQANNFRILTFSEWYRLMNGEPDKVGTPATGQLKGVLQ
jgi:hypothetical protein